MGNQPAYRPPPEFKQVNAACPFYFGAVWNTKASVGESGIIKSSRGNHITLTELGKSMVQHASQDMMRVKFRRKVDCCQGCMNLACCCCAICGIDCAQIDCKATAGIWTVLDDAWVYDGNLYAQAEREAMLPDIAGFCCLPCTICEFGCVYGDGCLASRSVELLLGEHYVFDMSPVGGAGPPQQHMEGAPGGYQATAANPNQPLLS